MSETPSETKIDWLHGASKGRVRIGRRSDQIVVEWPGVGRLVSSPGASVVFMPDADADVRRLGKFQATDLLACRRYLAGRLSLHGSAVQLAGGAVALIGESGAGKSTMAMELVEHEAAAFFADDVVPIDWHGPRPFVVPVEDSFWLSADTRAWFGLEATSADKRSHGPRRRASTPEPLLAVVQLEFDETREVPEIEPLTGQDTFVMLSRAHICYPTESDHDALRNLEARAGLASAVPVLVLRRRRSLAALRASARALAQRLAALSLAGNHR